MTKGMIAIALAAAVCAGPAHAGGRDTTLRKGAQLLLEYAEEHGGEWGKEFGKHVGFTAVLEGLREILFKKPEQLPPEGPVQPPPPQPPLPGKPAQPPPPDLELQIRKILEEMLVDRQFRERQKADSEIFAYLGRWNRCSNQSYLATNPDAGIEACTEIVRSEGEQPIQDIAIAYSNRGTAYMAKGDDDRATWDYSKAIEINPKFAEAYYNRGNALSAKGDNDRAIADYNKAIEINPKFAEAYGNRGNAYSAKGDNDRAIVDYSKVIEINPRDAFAYYNRGNAYSAKGDHDRAIADYNKAIEINPKYADAYYNRGLTYEYLGDKAKAIGDYKLAFALFGSDTDAAKARAALTRLGAAPGSSPLDPIPLRPRDWTEPIYPTR